MGGSVQKIRCDHIDVAKGIGILLIVGLHTGFHWEVGVSFEMPLFFLLSGVFVRADKPGFLRKKVRTLLVPSFCCYLPIAAYNTLYSLHSGLPLAECFQKSSLTSAVWFLVSLFWIHLLAWLLTRNRHRNWQLAAFSACSVVGYLLSRFDVPSWMFVNTSISCSFYYYLGMYFSGWLKRDRWRPGSLSLSLLIGVLSLAVCSLVYYLTSPFIFYRNNVLDGNYWVVTACALTGSLGVISLSHCITGTFLKKVFLFYGRNSLIILCVHLYVTKVVTHFVSAPWAVFLITVALMWPVSLLCRRYLPAVFGIGPLGK